MTLLDLSVIIACASVIILGVTMIIDDLIILLNTSLPPSEGRPE